MDLSRAMRSRPPGSAERGAALVEFALLLPVLVSLILGLTTSGIAYNRKISMTDAVREGSRFGATLAASPFAASDLSTWSTSVTQRVYDLSGGELSASQGTVCAQLVTAPDAANACGVVDPVNTPAGSHIAKVSATKSATLQAGFFTRVLRLSSKTASRYERETS